MCLSDTRPAHRAPGSGATGPSTRPPAATEHDVVGAPLCDSFPASDPPSRTGQLRPTRTGQMQEADPWSRRAGHRG
jgi:hypothetical protein